MKGRQGLRRAITLVIALNLAAIAAKNTAAQDSGDSVPEEPTLTVRITPPKPYLQEEIVQVVRVIAPHPFEEIVLDLPPVQGAEMITLRKPRNRKFETYGGEGYIYETSRALFPKRSGDLVIPPVRISGTIGISRDEKRPFALRSEGTTLNVRPPPPAFSEDWWLVARDVEIDEGWSRPLDDIRVGDHVTRSISVTVAGVTGEHLPELSQGRSSGLTILPGRTERSTEITPSGVIGKIKRTFDLRVDVDQPINLSPVRVVWWNTSTEIERRSAAPAVRIEPLPRDIDALVAGVMAEAAEARSASRQGIAIVLIGGLAILAAMIVWLSRTRRAVRREDRLLRQALMTDPDPVNAVRALQIWAGSIFPNERSMTLEQLGQKLGPTAADRIERLQQAAFGGSTGEIESTNLVMEIVAIAREQRVRTIGSVFSGLVDSLLGPDRRLIEIDQRTTGTTR
ncbi:MAG: hypothetical protein AAF543_00565 [Pseudomonadota bacterium]